MTECRIGDQERLLQFDRQIVYLLPFDIKIALQADKDPNDIDMKALTSIVTSWMEDSFKAKSASASVIGVGASFGYLVLEVANRRQLQTGDASPTFYKVVFQGLSLWNLESSDTEPVEPLIVELIQRETLVQDNILLEMIREADSSTGLGTAVLDLRADIATGSNGGGSTNGDDGSDETLQIIIMIAIIVACLAFCLLVFAVVWAWRTDISKREAYKTARNQPNEVENVAPKKTVTKSPEKPKSPPRPKSAPAPAPKPVVKPPPPQEIPSQSNYPDSVISDSVAPDSVISNDVDNSYAGYSVPHQQQASVTPSAKFEPRELNDNASMSSMDSYGYSLDGYASSLGPAQTKFPGGALNMPSSGSALGADESDTDLAPSVKDGDSYGY